MGVRASVFKAVCTAQGAYPSDRPDRHIGPRCVGKVARIRNSSSRALTLDGACATVIFLPSQRSF
jgi:hypothetical protein